MCEIALWWRSEKTCDDKSILVQVMAWWHQTKCHNLSPCSPWFMSPYGITRPHEFKRHSRVVFLHTAVNIIKICSLFLLFLLFVVFIGLYKMRVRHLSCTNTLVYVYKQVEPFFCHSDLIFVFNCAVIFNLKFSNSCEGQISCTLPVKLSAGECHKTTLMISQHWFRWWFSGIRSQSLLEPMLT